MGPGCACSMVTVGEWLGAEYKTKGVKRVLSDRIKASLAAASTIGMWDMDDVPNFGAVDETHLDKAGKMLKIARTRRAGFWRPKWDFLEIGQMRWSMLKAVCNTR